MNDRSTVERAIRQALVRIEEVEADVAALIREPDRTARLSAELDALFARFPNPADRPPLFGTLVGVKDIFHVEGLPTRAGSRIPPSVLAGPEAESVSILREAGALVLAKTVTTEFAYFASGPTRNPHNLAHTPGGSSSGSAAAVAAGYCPLALGTQTIGSINRPAAFCGVFGFKPSHELISRHGVIPLSTTLDHVGLFGDDLPNLREAARALLGAPLDTKASHPTKRRPLLGIPTGRYLDRASDEAREHLKVSRDRLAAAGYELREPEALGDIEEIESRHGTILARDIAQTHAAWFDTYRDSYHPTTRELIERGRSIDDATYEEARAAAAEFRSEIVTAMETLEIDAWITPSAPGAAPRGIERTGDPLMNLPWTQAGLPTVTIPCGSNGEGLPLALQVVGRWQRDEELFEIAEGIATAVQAGRVRTAG